MAKIDIEKLNESVSSFVENPHWKKYLEEAPSGECKAYIKLNFYLSDIESDGPEKDAVIDKMNAYEDKLGLADWKHLLKYAGNNPFAGKCKKRIAELSEQ